MYLNEIDKLIGHTIDNFYLHVIRDNDAIKKMFGKSDFIIYQTQIYDLMLNFVALNIDKEEIKKLVKNNDTTYQIINSLKRYIAFYIFLLIGFYYTDKEETYINNIVEFSKNQYQSEYKIEQFFNSENNALLIKYNMFVKNILMFISEDQHKIDKIKHKPETKEIINFLNNKLGGEFVTSKFVLKNIENDVSIQAHNIIKSIIVTLLYTHQDRTNFIYILESTEMVDDEYIYIDIVISIKKTIDFALIDNLLEREKNAKNIIHYFWKYLEQYNTQQLQKESNDDKILALVNSGLIVPICDDFLLYHKDSEKYDKYNDKNNKKKDDTRLKYVLDKIESVTEYYSNISDENIKMSITKSFYQAMLNRKAILINVNENISIINNFINNISKKNIYSFKDFEHYLTYPYINFKDINGTGFNLMLDKNIDVVRAVSFNTDEHFKQLSKNDIIQTRVGIKDMSVNIVGFLIPTTKKSLNCVKLKNIINLRNISKSPFKNLLLAYLKETILNTTTHNASPYCIFDGKYVDTSSQYKHISQIKIKHIMGNLYDDVVDIIVQIIINAFQKKKLLLQKGYDIINKFEEHLFKINRNSDAFKKIELNLVNSTIKIKPVYDTKYDEIYDINIEQHQTNLKKQTSIEHLSHKIFIDTFIEEKKINVLYNTLIGICQHNVTYDYIMSIDKKDLTRYLEELNDFMNRYVTVNAYDEYICKSCGYSIDIKKYIEDGEFDNVKHVFVSYSTVINVKLEDVLGYEKYKTAIRNIDKIIDKIANICNISTLSKKSSDVHSRKKIIIKNTVDLLIENNKILVQTHKSRNIEKYGINKNLTDLFAFIFDNNIFVFSSKDKDVYKPRKQNNIIIYIIFLLLLESNKSNLSFLGIDKRKYCNINMFEKYNNKIFGDLKIIVDNKGTIKQITDFKLLCYNIYIFSCILTMHSKLWYHESTEKNKLLQSIIHTLIDVVNSVIETSITKKNDYLYSTISIKYFNKLYTFFNDDKLYDNIIKNNQYSTMKEQQKIKIEKKCIQLVGNHVLLPYDAPIRVLIVNNILLTKQTSNNIKILFGLNSMTNCETGEFHAWVFNDKTFICTICNKTSNSVLFDKKITEIIYKNRLELQNHNLAKKLCPIDGVVHIFRSSEKNEVNCIKCKKKENYNYSIQETNEIEKTIQKINSEKIDFFIKNEAKISNEIFKQQENNNKHIEKMYATINKDELKNMDKLINTLKQYSGDNEQSVNLFDNIYIIDHDQYGNNIKTNIVMHESKNKIIYKPDHTFFKTDVIYYINHTTIKVEIYYDAVTKYLIGYKEENKNYVENINIDKQIFIQYSIVNKINLFGHTHSLINVDKMYETYIDTIGNNKNIEQFIINKIISKRSLLLKKIIFNLNLCMIKISTKYKNQGESVTTHDIKMDAFIDTYSKKFDKILIKNNFMIDWKKIVNCDFQNTDVKTQIVISDSKIINYADINKIDKYGNVLTSYIIDELLQLYKDNDDNITKTFLSQFIVDFINLMFDTHYEENKNYSLHVKRTALILVSTMSTIDDKSSIKLLEGLYTEQMDIDKDKIADLKEEQGAIDYDYEKEDIVESGEEYYGSGFDIEV